MAINADRTQTSVRIYKKDKQVLQWRQANAVLHGRDKPSLADLIHEAVTLLAAQQ